MCHFKIFHSGYELNVVHTEPIDNIIKIASHNDHVFILTTAKQLFYGSLQQQQQQQQEHHHQQQNNESLMVSMRVQQIEFELIRTDVIDVACCVDSIYVVDENGFVQSLPTLAFDFDKRWNNIPILNYDSIYEGDNANGNDNNNNMVRVREVSCNNDGALFITDDRQLFAMGSFIGVCTSDQPIKVPQFVNYEILQIAMGKQFAVILTRKRSKIPPNTTNNRCAFGSHHTNPMDSINCDDTQSLASTSHSENDFDSLSSQQITSDTCDSNSMNSNSSGSTITNQSSATATTTTKSKLVDTMDGNNRAQQQQQQQPLYSPFIDNEYAIERWLNANDQIETQVWCFGSINQVGQLGVGDHVRRTNAVEVRSLRDQGVIRICSGDDHTAALTLDARLYLWGDNSNEQISHWLDKEDSSSPKRFHKNEQNIFDVQCGQQSTYVITNNFERYELSRSKYFGGISIAEECVTCGNCDHHHQQQQQQQQQHRRHTNLPIDYLFLASKQYLVIGAAWKPLRFEKYLTFEQQFLQDCLQNVRPSVEHFMRTLNRNINIRHPQLYRKFCQQYISITKLSAKNIAAILNFACYKIDFVAFIRYHIEYTHVYRQYAKLYCDILCSDDFQLAQQAIIPAHDFVSKFSIPLHHTSNYMDFINDLLQSNSNDDGRFLQIALTEWQRLNADIEDELKSANLTINFWMKNHKNIPHTLQRPDRRFILDSKNTQYPLKLMSSSRFKSNWFILFNDIFCHSTGNSSSAIKQYPLKTLWIFDISHSNTQIDFEPTPQHPQQQQQQHGATVDDVEKEIRQLAAKLKNVPTFLLRIETPEDQLMLTAPSQEVHQHWKNQLENQIKQMTGKANNNSQRRTTSYTFSDKHRVYSACRYLGQWDSGHMHGIGALEYPDGRMYTGQIEHNIISGYGRLVSTASTYEGHFADGHFNGFGTLEMHQLNEHYEGYFKNGLKHGFGIQQYFETNRTYIGEWENDLPNGYGVDDSENGKYMGNFLDGHRNGHGYCITADGTYFEGNFVDNESLNGGNGVAYFSNRSYYIGESLSIRGPSGRGTLYLPAEPIHCNDAAAVSAANHIETDNHQAISVCGSILSGSLGGNWDQIKINHGNILLNQMFDKYPSQFGRQPIDCQTKWLSLFSDWEHDVFDGAMNEIADTKKLWRKIIKYIDGAKQIELLKSTIATSEMIYKSDNNNEANRNGGGGGQHQQSSKSKPFAYESQPKNTAAVPKSMSLSRITGRNYKQNLLSSVERNKSISNEFLNNAMHFPSSNQLINVNVKAKHDHGDQNDAIEFTTTTTTLSTAPFTCVPHFAITKLDSKDLRMLRDYLHHAFKNQYHPLGILNARISYCFYTSYGCWKVKPISILSKHAMQEWESISHRIYEILCRLFPTLPHENGTLDDEFISPRSLLYPILLSEGVYSTLFVLYANKCSKRDEIYRQRIQLSEKKNDAELINFLKLSNKYLLLIKEAEFSTAIITLQQVKEKFCPREMLNLIEKTFKHVEAAAQIVSKCNESNDHRRRVDDSNVIDGNDNRNDGDSINSIDHISLTPVTATAPNSEMVQLNADNMMPLTIFLLLRAAIPHLGTEILLLEDLMGPDFEFVMNGFAGYCFTTIKAAYQHIINDIFLQ